MANVEIHCPDADCVDCSEGIVDKLNQIEGIEDFKMDKESIHIEYNKHKIKPIEIIEQLKKEGFEARLEVDTQESYGNKVEIQSEAPKINNNSQGTTKTQIYCPDIECDSCVKVISKKLNMMDGIKRFNVKKDSVEVEYDHQKIKAKHIIAAIEENGFRASFEPFTRKTFTERFREFFENKKKYEVEYTMLKYSGYALLLLLVLEAIAYFQFFASTPDFLSKYGWWIFYTDISVISTGAAIWHLKSYRVKVTTMTGMMIGMTVGMQSGMMIGMVLGATNGMFIGSLVTMILAVGLGWYSGKYGGIMGVLQGMMSGMMGGIMGAMTGVMMLVDNILWFMPLFMLLNVLMMWALSYLLFEEAIEENPKVERVYIDFATFASYCLAATLVLLLIILFGPRSGFAGAL